MAKFKFRSDICNTSRLGLLCLVAAAFMYMPAEASKRRTFKANSPSAQQPVENAQEVQQVQQEVVKQDSKQAGQSRSSQRNKIKHDESRQTAVNESVRNNSRSKAVSSTINDFKPGTKKDDKKKLFSIKVSKPNLEEIKSKTLNPKDSKFYYPNLWDKYNHTLKVEKMTPEEFRYLYLGYMFQEDYDPYRVSEYTKLTDPFRGKESELTDTERTELIENLKKSLQDNPFDLRQISFLVNMLKRAGKDNEANKWERRLENLLGAIKSTGTGLDAENAWYVIYPVHEYDMVQLQGYNAVDIDYSIEGFDHLLVEPDGSVKISKPVKGFYFNVEIPQKEYMTKHIESQGDSGADE